MSAVKESEAEKTETINGVNTGEKQQEAKEKNSLDEEKKSGMFSFWWKLRMDSEYRMRWIHTASVIWMFITLGWNVSVVGGTFPDLRHIIRKDLDTASWIFTLGSLGYLLGAFIGGLLFDRMNRLLLLVAVTTLSAASIAAIPWCSSFPAMLAINFISGLFSGAIDVGGNSHVASIWGGNAAPFMQSIHFGFSFGGIVSPLTAEPFLAPKSCAAGTNSSMSTATTDRTAIGLAINISTAATVCDEVYGETHIHFAYAIAGIVSLSAAVPFMTFFLLSSRYKTYINSPYESVQESNDEIRPELPALSRQRQILFVTLLMLLISNYACTEGRFSGLLTTFLADHLGWSTSDGLHVTSLFWGTFAAGRFLSILVTRILKTTTMIFVYLVALTVSFVFMFCAAMFDVRELVWACAALAGLSMSAIFPSIFTWTAESFLRVTGLISAVYLVGVSFFNMLLPLLFGYLMDNYTQMYFVDLLLGMCVISVGLYITIQVLVKLLVDPLRKNYDI